MIEVGRGLRPRRLQQAGREPLPAVVEPSQTMNIQKMMQQAQQMQDRMQKQMAETVIEASAGGVVTVKVNGAKQLLSITIDPEAVDKDDVEALQDAILVAVQDAQRKADEAMNSSMSGMLGGMKLPGM